MNLRVYLALLLLCGLVAGQDDGSADADAAADAGGEGGEGGEEGKDGSGEECEESWDYIEFLRGMVNEKVEKTLEALREARNLKGEAVLEDTVSATMKQVLEIREAVLDRIFKLRKEEIEICEDQNIKQEDNLTNLRMEIMGILLKLIEKDAASIEKLKEIRDDLLEFRMNVNNEVMRVMMLPQGRAVRKATSDGDCTECDLLQELSEKVDGLINCAENDGVEGGEEGDDEEEEGSNTDGGEEGGEGGSGGEGECMPPTMYFMDLMDCNRKIDDETERLFPSLFATLDDEQRTKIETDLKNLKAIREEIEDVITKLSKTKDEDKLKKTVARSLSGTSSTLKNLLKECKAGCGPEGCDSCGAEVLYEMLEKMEYYMQIYNDTESGREPVDQNDEVRRDLMKYISSNSEDSTKILGKKIEGSIDECDQEKQDVYNRTKNPMWMLVNTTIFTEGTEEPLVMVETMVEMLNQLLLEYCAGEEAPVRKTKEGPSCEWEEYEQTGEYINKIDEIIQESLFKPKEDSAKRDAQFGFVEINMLLNKRVEKLFSDGMVCPNEATAIKKEWMPELNKCMSVFMNSKLKFTQMTRLERIQCTKELRTNMERRRSDLLSQELEKSIDQIGEEAEGSSN